MSSQRNSCFKLGVPGIDRISEAVRNGDEDRFRELISLFKSYDAANLNQLDSRGSHPLHEAVAFRRQRMLRTLLHYKNALRLDVNITNSSGQTALEIAVRNRNSPALRKLLKYDCSKEVLRELRQQLGGGNHCPLSSSQRDVVKASYQSEMILLCPYNPRQATETREPARNHLLHPISGTHWSGEICEKAVRSCYRDLAKYMEPAYVIPLLVQERHLNPDHVNQILSLQTKQEQALQLLALLHRCGGPAYVGLFKALKEETEHQVHQDLLQQLERSCELLVNSGLENAFQAQELFEKVTTIYDGDDLGTPIRARSVEPSYRTESGFYSATPTAALQGTHSSGRMLTPFERTSSNGSKKIKLSTEKKPDVVMKGRINRRACSNFRTHDEHKTRGSLHVINTVVKRDRAPVQATMTESNTDSGACLVASTGHLTPLHSQLLVSSSPNPLDSVPFFVESSEQEKEYSVEKDGSVEVSVVSSPKGSAPIDIPSRNESCATLPCSPAQDSASVNSRDNRSPRAALTTRKNSTDTSSSDTSSSDGSYILLDIRPSAPKDLSNIPPATRSWKKAITEFFNQCKVSLSSNPTAVEVSPTTSSCENGRTSPSYVMGCGMKM